MSPRRLLRRLRLALIAVRATAGRRRPTDSAVDPLVVVFSRDRALQLELFLRTMQRHWTAVPPMTVMFSSSTAAHERSYEQLFGAVPDLPITAHAETDFASEVVALLETSTARDVVFFVDDIAFVETVDLEMLRGWDSSRRGVLSLRLGRNIRSSFNSSIPDLRRPDLRERTVRGQRLLTWRWRSGAADWSLSTSLDGNVLPRAVVLEVLRSGRGFRAPNSLEAALGDERWLFSLRRGWCWPVSRLVNFPLNSVKSEDFDFPHLGFDEDEFLAAWDAGLRLDSSGIDAASVVSPHADWAPQLVRPSSESATAPEDAR